MNYAAAISLAHGLNLLQIYGLKPFYLYLEKVNKGEVGGKGLQAQLRKIPIYESLWEHLEKKIAELDPVALHPKFKKLVDICQRHFEQHEDTRIIVFSQYRSSVDEIVDILSKISSKVRPCAFIGQTKIKSDTALNYNQKKQLEVILFIYDDLLWI